MLSVLIPVFNYNAYPLITGLHKQLIHATIPFEILCIDDASNRPMLAFENEIKNLLHTRLLKLSKNIGRSKIRNLLATKAQFDWLLFIDADCLPNNEIFIDRYITEIKKNTHMVICGGISYQEKKPTASKVLRWKYGRHREQHPLQVRKEQAYRLFFSANFVIYKPTFMEIMFDETLTKYGLEDTLFAKKIRDKNLKIHHIENTVIHEGLDNADEFMQKTKSAITNGYKLFTTNKLGPSQLKHLAVYLKLKKLRLVRTYLFIYQICKPLINANLRSKFPTLIGFDLFKLYTLCQLTKTKTH
ncbi:glycosyltransferase family 2 protein [Flavobacteriaceae bacterium F08102]|nr:glycosyltransferase family 2 protein [Flavobacteriaceae bacterium F08102]